MNRIIHQQMQNVLQNGNRGDIVMKKKKKKGNKGILPFIRARKRIKKQLFR